MNNKSSFSTLFLFVLLGSLVALSSSRCGIDFCSICSNNQAACVECNPGFKPNTNGSLCLDCNIPNCISCSANQTCSQCSANFSIFPGGQSCIQCNVPNCLECNAVDNCISCANGFTPAGGACHSCMIQNCLQCNADNMCATCIQFYNPSPDQSVCLQCTPA